MFRKGSRERLDDSLYRGLDVTVLFLGSVQRGEMKQAAIIMAFHCASPGQCRHSGREAHSLCSQAMAWASSKGRNLHIGREKKISLVSHIQHSDHNPVTSAPPTRPRRRPKRDSEKARGGYPALCEMAGVSGLFQASTLETARVRVPPLGVRAGADD